MWDLPQATAFNKRIPKQTFYEKLSLSSAMQKVWTDDIQAIYWRHKIATTTTTLAKGAEVEEIEVLEIQLKKPELPKAVLQQIDKAIPYHILFILSYEGKCQAWIGYEQRIYYHTAWVEADMLSIHLDGLDMDKVYQNLVRRIAGDALGNTQSATSSLADDVAKSEERQKIEKEIAKLTAKMQKEQQFNRKVELHRRIKELKEKLGGLT